MDGKANGRIKCTLANWTGVAYKIPRTELEKCKGRSDLSQSGVYFLFGSDDTSDKKTVYIGQAGTRKNGEGILRRLNEHKRNQKEDYWTEAVVFTTSNNSFGPTEISYLEHRFCTMAMQTNRYFVRNSNEPSLGNITEEKESELEEFIDFSKIVMGALGYRLFEFLTESHTDSSYESEHNSRQELLYFSRKSRKSGLLIEATGAQTSEGFVVFKGSLIETIDSDTIPTRIKEHRQKANIDAQGILQEDLLFTSPSYAAAFVIGGHVNGLTHWKTADGITLKELENREEEQY
ncbi:MAG: GIY-YIG nuclease family protein [Firmicutes bacterium]|nr:GIY-YIG nuclease family protein [Bacillota bacterium]